MRFRYEGNGRKPEEATYVTRSPFEEPKQGGRRQSIVAGRLFDAERRDEPVLIMRGGLGRRLRRTRLNGRQGMTSEKSRPGLMSWSARPLRRPARAKPGVAGEGVGCASAFPTAITRPSRWSPVCVSLASWPRNSRRGRKSWP